MNFTPKLHFLGKRSKPKICPTGQIFLQDEISDNTGKLFHTMKICPTHSYYYTSVLINAYTRKIDPIFMPSLKGDYY